MPILGDPERLLSLSNALYIIAAVLTVLATFAIVYFGNKVTTVKQQQLKAYQADADARIAQANANAAQSGIETAKANATAAGANSIAQVAQQRAEEAKEKAASANEATEQLRKERALLEINLEGLKRANEEQGSQIKRLENDAKARSMTQEQRQQIVKLLRQEPNKKPIKIRLVAVDFEAISFAHEVQAVLMEGGFEASLESTGEIYEGFGIATGVYYPLPDQNAQDLLGAFRYVGFDCQLQIDYKLPRQEFFVFVGNKPHLK